MLSGESLLEAWRVNDRVTIFLIERTSDAVWSAALPGAARRTVRSVAAHLHNTRRSWLRGLAAKGGAPLPPAADRLRATPREVVALLQKSGARVLQLIEAGIENGGDFPGVGSKFVWGAWPRDVVLFTAYAVSHEAHHRGQIVVTARAIGERLPPQVVQGLWQWSSRLKEAQPKGQPRPVT